MPSSFAQRVIEHIIAGAFVAVLAAAAGWLFDLISRGSLVHLLGGITLTELKTEMDRKLATMQVEFPQSNGYSIPQLYDEAPTACPKGWVNASGDGPAKSANYIRNTTETGAMTYGYVYRFCYRFTD